MASSSDQARRASRKWLWLAAGVVAVLALAAGAWHLITQHEQLAALIKTDPGSIPDDPDLKSFAIAYAQPIYDRRCAACHGDHMQGDKSRGIPAFSGRKWLYGEGQVAQIERTILYGIRSGNPKGWNLADMPGFGLPNPYKRYQIPSLEPGEIRDVIEFLLVAGHKPGDRDAAARGAKIFADKGQCFDCHSGDAQGDAAIGAPSLIDGNWLYGNGTRQNLTDTITRGRSGVCPAFVSELGASTIRALAVLIYANSHPQAAEKAAAAQSPGPGVGTGG